MDIHVAFLNCSGQASVGDIYYLTNRNETGRWDSTIVGQGYDYLDMVIDKNDKLHISYYNPPSIGGIVYQSKEIDGNWGTPELIESNWQGVQMEGMGTGIAVDKKGEPHIIYAGQTDNDNTEDIKYAYKNNGQWHITTIEKGTGMSTHSSIGIDNLNHVHVCYYSMKQNKLIYAVKLDSGWTREVISSKGKWWNDIAIANDGTAHICYTDDDDRNQIYYASSRVEIDADLDGVPNKNEQGENGDDPVYDGNGDGIPDFQQKNVTSFHTSDGKYYVTLACDDSLLLSDVSSGDVPSIYDVPPNFDFPFGAFHFTILGLSYGDSTTVDLILPEGTIIDKYYKYGSTLLDNKDHWYEFMYDGETGAVINDNIVTLHLVDGLRGDNDLTINGIIFEPGLPAVIVTDVKNDESKLPDKYALYQNYPNPFNPTTTIKYSIPTHSSSSTLIKGNKDAVLVSLKIFDLLGRKIATLVNKKQFPGIYSVTFNASGLPSGVYFYKLSINNYIKTKRMLLLK